MLRLNQPYIRMYITTHLPPPPRLDVQDPHVVDDVAILIHTPSDQHLGVILSIVEAAGSMGISLCQPRGSFSPLQFGPLLGQVTQYAYIQIVNSTAACCDWMLFTVLTVSPDNSAPSTECALISSVACQGRWCRYRRTCGHRTNADQALI